MENKDFKFNFDINTETAKSNLEELKSWIELIKEQLSKADPGSDSFKSLATSLNEANTQLAAINKSAELAGNSVAQLAGFASVAETIKSGFTGAQAAAELFGIENGKLTKIIDKVSKAQEVLASIQTINKNLQKDGAAGSFLASVAHTKLGGALSGATKSFTALNTVMKASIIGAVISAVALLVSYWDKIKSTISGVSSEQEKLAQTSKEKYVAEKNAYETLTSQENILRSQGKSEKQILQLKITQLDTVIAKGEAEVIQQRALLKSQIEAERRNKEILKGILEFVSGGITPILHLVDLVGSAFGKNFGLAEKFKDFVAGQFFDPEQVEKEGEEALKASEDELLRMKDQRAGFQLQIKAIDTESANKAKQERTQKNKEEEEERKQKSQNELNAREAEAKKRIEDAKNYADTEHALLEQVFQDKEQLFENDLTNLEKRLAKGELTEKQFADERVKLEDNKTKALQQIQEDFHKKSFENLNNTHKQQAGQLETDFKNKVITQDEYNTKLLAVDADYNAKKANLITIQGDENLALKKIVDGNEIAQLKAQNEKRKEVDEEAKEIERQNLAFKKQIQDDGLNLLETANQLFIKKGKQQNDIQKTLSLVKIGIDTANAISSAIATSNSPTPDNVATGGLAGIAKFVTISAQILAAAAKAKSVLNSGGSGGNAGSGSSPAAPTITPPQIQAPQAGGTQIISRQQSPEPIKVFVTEADIRKSQQKVSVIEGQSVVV